MKIGIFLRKTRKSQGLTLVELSKKSNIALATLSRIETGKMTGTLDCHVQIAKALGFSLPGFYSEIERLEASQKGPKESDYTNLFVREKGSSSVILTKDIFTKKMLPVLIILEKGGKTHQEELNIGTEKFLYVVQGKIEVAIDKDKKILGKNTSLYLDASKPHYVKNIGNSEARCLCVITPVNI